MKQEEYHAQVAIFNWKQLNRRIYPDLEFMFGTLNGVRLPIGLAKKAKASGNVKGVPDIWLPVRRGKYVGLVIELKKELGGTVSPEQRKFLRKLENSGWFSVVCHGSANAIKAIEWYLKLVILSEVMT